MVVACKQWALLRLLLSWYTFNRTSLFLLSWNIFIVISCKLTKCVSIYRIARLEHTCKALFILFIQFIISCDMHTTLCRHVHLETVPKPLHGFKGENSTAWTVFHPTTIFAFRLCDKNERKANKLDLIRPVWIKRAFFNVVLVLFEYTWIVYLPSSLSCDRLHCNRSIDCNWL